MTKEVPYYCDNDDNNIIRLFIIRHGQTEHNVKKILQGHKDTSINPTGEEQATKLGHYLRSRGIHFDKVVSSDLKRCRQTTALVLKHSKQENVPTSYTSGLRERYMGVIEGMQITEAEKYADKHGEGSFRNFGEKSDDFVARLTGCVEEEVAEASNEGVKNLALVSHGGAIRMILQWLKYENHQSHKIIVFNTSVTIVDYVKDSKQFIVRRVGNTQHLGDGEFVVSDLRLR